MLLVRKDGSLRQRLQIQVFLHSLTPIVEDDLEVTLGERAAEVVAGETGTADGPSPDLLPEAEQETILTRGERTAGLSQETKPARTDLQAELQIRGTSVRAGKEVPHQRKSRTKSD